LGRAGQIGRKVVAKAMKKSDLENNGTVEETAEMNMETPENQGQIVDTETPIEVELVEEEINIPLGMQAELEAAKSRAQEATDQYVRLLAEFDNFRKRSRREYESLQEYASEKVLTSLLTVLDDFDRTLTAMEKTDNLTSIKEGITLVTNKLHRTLIAASTRRFIALKSKAIRREKCWSRLKKAIASKTK
jgi:molecular chaperone GrpE